MRTACNKFIPSRRDFLRSVASLVATVSVEGNVHAATGEPANVSLRAALGRWPLAGKSYPSTEVWSYGNRIPGPEIRVKQGEPVKIAFRNDLPNSTTVHWHGIRLPNAMDGVPGLTQLPVKPGEEFLYEFTPPDAGTFWYHPHADSLQQLGRGMAGAFIVEEPDPIPVDRDLFWVLSDWRLTNDAQIASGFGNRMEAAMSGRVGNTVTINGEILDEVAVKAGERVRLRLINSSLARLMSLRFDGHQPIVVAIDGQPCDPHLEDRLLLGPAMRIDLILDMHGEPGRRYLITDDFYPDLTYWLTALSYERSSTRARVLDAPSSLPRNPLPEPDLKSAERYGLTLQGGMMGGAGMGMGMMSHGAVWAINGKSMTGDGHSGMTPLMSLTLGKSYAFTIRNDTAWWHPIHLHGYSFRVLRRNGSRVPHHQWADTILMAPRETADIAFVADNPGDWMLHCHVIDHQVTGMMAVLRVS